MTYPSTLDMVNAVLATLNATPNVTAYLGEAPKDAVRPMVIVHAAMGTTDGTVGDRLRDLTVAFQTTAIGDTAEQAAALADLTAAALDKVAPAVTGRTSFPIRQDGPPQPVRRDDTLVVAGFYAVALWTFTTSV